MEEIVNNFNSLILQLRSENENLSLRLAKVEILANNRLESVKQFQVDLENAEFHINKSILENASLARERDDALAIVHNIFAEREECRKKMDIFTKLQIDFENEKKLNNNLQQIFSNRKTPQIQFTDYQQFPTKTCQTCSTIATQTNTEGPLLIDKSSQTNLNEDELKYIFRE
jgi:hypothetical protein